MIHIRYVARSILVAALLALAAAPAQAHPPRKVHLVFDAEEKTLQVEVEHEIGRAHV